MTRLGPLQELPLENFLFPDDNVRLPLRRPHKRPLSPGGPSPRTPAKRRVVNFDTTRSPVKMDSPPSASYGGSRFAPMYFSALLSGPDSPARRLDFSTPKASRLSTVLTDEMDTPKASASVASSTLAPSPTLLDPNQYRAKPSLQMTVQRDNTVDGCSNGYVAVLSSPTPQPRAIPRRLIPPDPQSIHYPGFVVYQDPYEEAPSSAADRGNEKGDDCPTSVAAKLEKEADKENHGPRKKAHKSTAVPAVPGAAAWAKAGLVPPAVHLEEPGEMAKSTLLTPRMKGISLRSGGGDEPLAPTRRSQRLIEQNHTSLLKASASRASLSKEERKARRKAMENEAENGVDGFIF
ncbi:uncharacterized protein LAESUDRAFT_719357 [Laetiporus sulphureus 93-53]|uniref:Uncharacterized protein n=1 Tax=Laetiporus sulphureus 93-53 TaxID=1314785 RepID=A0A165IGJ7_9APHY|nr:uncharacterized protein LAESUDRAFT_719357 [Laetiporus sulphureus 93-53]KZT13043.1 hypothetical protein LAESUDRAFT_719357 [Laetiporus sulphureus 93-53]